MCLQNGRTLQILDLCNFRILDLKSIEHIFNNCVELTELSLENTNISLKESYFFSESPTPQRERISIGILYKEDPDEHIKILVERCNQQKQIHLKYYVPITNSVLTKGQLISKCPYEKSVLSKIPTKKFPRFLS